MFASRRRPALTAVCACLLLAACSLLLPSAPSYDPWSWLIWGREIAHGELSTTTGPSWKPLTTLLTVPISVFGEAAPAIWLVLARAGTLGAIVVAGLLGHRLAGRLGGALVVVLLAPAAWFWSPQLMGFSEGLLVLAVLLAVHRHLAGHHAQAFALGVAAALLKPEAWPFLAAHGLWLVVRAPGRLRWVAPALVTVPLLWLLPEQLGSGNPWRAGERAGQAAPNAPANADHPAITVVENAVQLAPLLALVGIVLGTIVVVAGRVGSDERRLALILTMLGSGWLLVVAVMTETGRSSGINRYLVVPVALTAVLGGAGIAAAARALVADRPARGLPALLAGILVAGTVASGANQARAWPRMFDALDHHADIVGDLDKAVRLAGGAENMRSCGAVHASFYLTPAVAWKLRLRLEQVTDDVAPAGTLLRTQLFSDRPIEPPQDIWRGAPGHRLVGATDLWEVETTGGCS